MLQRGFLKHSWCCTASQSGLCYGGQALVTVYAKVTQWRE